MVAVATADEVS